MGLARQDDLTVGSGSRSRRALGLAASAVTCGTSSQVRGLPRQSDPLLPPAARRLGGRRCRLPRRSAAMKVASREPWHLRRSARQQSRLETYGPEMDTVDEHGLSFLERMSMAAGTLELYRQIYDEFRQRCRRAHLPTKTRAQLDRAVLSMLHEMFKEGELSSESQKLVSVVKKFRPELRRAGSLPRSLTAIRGFRRIAPPATRQPLPWECACLIAETLVNDEQWLVAVATLLCFCLYARPSEVLRIRGGQLVPPVKRSGRAHCFWSVTLHPHEFQRTSKTGMSDESLRIDIAPYLCLVPALRKLAAETSETDKLFPFSYGSWARKFEDAAGRAGMAALAPTLYQLRHGGASQDAATKGRTTAEIKKRGRWLDDRSLIRYENGGRVTELLRRLPPAVRRTATGAGRRIGAILLAGSRRT